MIAGHRGRNLGTAAAGKKRRGACMGIEWDHYKWQHLTPGRPQHVRFYLKHFPLLYGQQISIFG